MRTSICQLLHTGYDLDFLGLKSDAHILDCCWNKGENRRYRKGRSRDFPVPSSRPWYAKGFVCALQESVSPLVCKFWQLYGGLVATSSKRTYATPRSASPRGPAHTEGHCDPYLHRRHSNTQRQV